MTNKLETKQSPKEILKSLETEDKYVFHGSENPNIEVLEPRQAYTIENSEQVKDDDPAVHASKFADVAIFMALINSQNCPDGFLSGFFYREGKGVVFHATQKTLDQLNKNSKGYVYVFSRDCFTARNKSQFVSYTEVRPLKIIEVGFDDLPQEIEVRDEE